MGQSFDITQLTAWQNADRPPEDVATREDAWSPQKRYLMKTLRRIRERGGTDDDIYSYLMHYEKLPDDVKNRMAGVTINPPEPVETPGKLRGASMHALQGITWGLGDEMMARLHSVAKGITYEQALDEYQKELGQFANEHRALALISDIGGGIIGGSGALKLAGRGATALRAAGMARAAGVADKVSDAARLALAPSKSVGRKMVASAALGAAGGAARGFGEGEGDIVTRGAGIPLPFTDRELPTFRLGEERMQSAQGGGKWGILLGPAFAIGGSAVVNKLQIPARYISKSVSQAARKLGRNIPEVYTPSATARAHFVERLAKDGVGIDDLIADAGDAMRRGQPITLFDLLAKRNAWNTMALLDDAKKVRDPHLQQTLEIAAGLVEKAGTMGDDSMSYILTKLFGSGKMGLDGLSKVQESVMTDARAASKPLYDTAHGLMVSVGSELRKRLRGSYGDVFQTAYSEARKKVMSEADDIFGAAARKLPGRVPTLKEVLSGEDIKDIPLVVLDYMKRHIDDVVEDAYTKRGITDIARAADMRETQIARELHTFINEVVDGASGGKSSPYKQARAIFSSAADVNRAGRLGRVAYKENWKGEKVRGVLDGFGTEAERQQFRLGWLDGPAEQLALRRGDKVNFAATLFGANPTGAENRTIEAFRQLFTDPRAADDAIELLHGTARFYETAAKYGKPPTTTMRGATEALSGASAPSGGLTAGATAAVGKIGVFTRIAQSAYESTVLPFARDVGDEISTFMLNGAVNPGEVVGFLSSIKPIMSGVLRRKIMARAAAGLTGGQQAQQFGQNPLEGGTGALQVGVGGLSRLFSTLGKQ